jgi:hypothetical protein
VNEMTGEGEGGTSSSSMSYQLVEEDLPAGRRRLCLGLPAAAIMDGELWGRGVDGS